MAQASPKLQLRPGRYTAPNALSRGAAAQTLPGIDQLQPRAPHHPGKELASLAWARSSALAKSSFS